MPRRSLLKPSEREMLLALPETEEERIRHYTLTEPDLAVIEQRRGDANRLGFAIQLCYLRYPGIVLPVNQAPEAHVLGFVAQQLRVEPKLWSDYAQREQTRREHLQELQDWLQLRLFGTDDPPPLVEHLAGLAHQTDEGMVLATALVERLRMQRVLLPGIEVIERVCAEALTLGTRQVYEALCLPLSEAQRRSFDGLLRARPGFQASTLAWLRQPAGKPKAKYILAHLERLKVIEDLHLTAGIEKAVHQNWQTKLVSESKQMSAQHLRDLEPTRRYATLVVLLQDIRATLIDETLELHERLLSSLFNAAKHRHAERFQESGKSIHEKLRLFTQIGQALLNARQSGADPFAAIEALLSWEALGEMLTETEQLARPGNFDFLPLLSAHFSQLRRYTPTLLERLRFYAVPAASPLLQGVEILKDMNQREKYELPDDAPMTFVRKRWKPLVKTETGIDRRFYEFCVLSELKNALRAGDMWVEGSRQFKAFEDYLLPVEVLAQPVALGLAMETDCESYLTARLGLLTQQLQTVERLAAQNQLPDAVVTEKRLKISPLENAVPAEADTLIQRAYSLLPHVKITELLLEVDAWTGFSRHFTHLKSEEPAQDRHLLLTALLADGINLGLTKMAEACPGVTYAKLSWLQAWHIREETYAAALAELVNAQSQHPFARWWGDGTTSSSDGQRFRAGGRGEFAGQVNPKYGSEPGVLFYTHVSDQYAPFHTQVIHAPLGEATHVLDGLLYHQSELRIKEHYTDSAGFTEHVFALMHLLGFRFAPRIRDLADKRLYVPGDPKQYPTLAGLIGERLQIQQIRAHWGEILRLGASVQQGTVTASLILRKLGSYPRQNSLALALRELGRIERTLFMLEWLQSPELRRRVQAGLNKGEARNALARAVFFHRLGEIRDRRFENQRYRASGLNLVVAAIILWNTVYLERGIQALRDRGQTVDDELLSHLSPLGWEHINLTGDYTWKLSKQVERGRFRQLRSSKGS